MVKVTDARGAQWTVRRRWWYDMTDMDEGLIDSSYGFVGLLVGLAFPALVWPFWFLAHWLGLPWLVPVFEGDKLVDEQKVRGWLRSRRRIREIAERISAGTLTS